MGKVLVCFEPDPESVNYLKKISDGSLNDITSPWKSFGKKEKLTEKFKNDLNEIDIANHLVLHHINEEVNPGQSEEKLIENKNSLNESIYLQVGDNLGNSDTHNIDPLRDEDDGNRNQN